MLRVPENVNFSVTGNLETFPLLSVFFLLLSRFLYRASPQIGSPYPRPFIDLPLTHFHQMFFNQIRTRLELIGDFIARSVGKCKQLPPAYFARCATANNQ